MWTLNIYNSDSLRLTSSKGLIYYGPVSGSIPSLDPSIINFRIVQDDGDIMIQMIEKSCEDNNSSIKTVEVQIKIDSKDGNTILEGCGNFIPDPWLSGKWQIIKSNSQDIDSEDFNGKVPELSLDLIKQSFSGNDGCNAFHGKVKFRDGNIIFGLSAGTLMACPNMELSNQITSSINEKVLSYYLGDHLILYEGEKEVLRLKQLE